MIQSFSIDRSGRYPSALDDIIDRYGAWRVLRAALGALINRRRRRRRIAAEDLSEHIRRDIGLHPDYRVPHISQPRF